jgi:hypothetical protein
MEPMKRCSWLPLLLLLSNSAIADTLPPGPCLKISGRVHSLHTPGPPNYGENPSDSHLLSWLLTLDFPRKLRVRDLTGREYEVPDIKDIQIVGSQLSKIIRAAAAGNAHQTITGCMYLAESGHHVTKVIFDTNVRN